MGLKPKEVKAVADGLMSLAEAELKKNGPSKFTNMFWMKMGKNQTKDMYLAGAKNMDGGTFTHWFYPRPVGYTCKNVKIEPGRGGVWTSFEWTPKRK